MNRPTKLIAGNYVALATDEIILVDASASPGFWFVNLPPPTTVGQMFTVRKTDSSGKSVRVQFNGAFTLDGVPLGGNRYELKVQGEALTVVSDGTGWQRLDQWTKNIAGGNSANVQPGRAYVSSNYGNDSYSGFVPWQAKQTIQAAMDLATATEIHVDRGTYTETVTMKQGKVLIGGPDVTIRAPSATADVVVMSVGNELSHLKLMGFNGPGWTGRCVVIEKGAGYNLVDNVAMGNGAGYLPNYGIGGGPDPGYGGTGIYIRDSEQNRFENWGVSNCRVGLDVDDTGQGCSMLTFRKGHINSCWKEVAIGVVSGSLGNFTFDQIKSSGGGYGASREHGYLWDVCVSNSLFTNVDFSETQKSNGRFWRGTPKPNDPPAHLNRGGRNTFINCNTSLQCKLYIESHGNKFVNFYAQNDLVLVGDWNEIDGISTTGGGNVQITGKHNSIRRHAREANSANAVMVTDTGLGTTIDGVTRGNGPPTTGYGWRKGRIILNEDPKAGKTMGWICTVEALGPPQPQGGKWIELPVMG